MMDHEQAPGLIENYFEAYNVRDVDTLAMLLSPEVIYDSLLGNRTIGLPDFKAELAKEGRSLDPVFEDILIIGNRDGGRAAVECTLKGDDRRTDSVPGSSEGTRYSKPAGVFFEIENGLCLRVSVYANQSMSTPGAIER